MNILLLDNNFAGAHESFGVFFNEIESCLSKEHKIIRTSENHSNEDIIGLYDQYKIDFSLGIGKYARYTLGTPLYEIKKIRHYQWIIDSPYKYDMDCESEYIKYILIDKEFKDMLIDVKLTPLILPLGVSLSCGVHIGERPGIIFSGQIRDLNIINQNIEKSEAKSDIRRLIEVILNNLNVSFIEQFIENTRDVKKEKLKEIFTHVNSYIRAYKRKLVISNINDYPLILLGKVEDGEIRKKTNVVCLGEKTYYKTLKTIGDYKYSLNIEPNYKCCIHDRITSSINAGSCVITDRNALCCDVFGETMIYFDYYKISEMEKYVLSVDDKTRYEKVTAAKEMIRSYSWDNILNTIIDDFRMQGV